MNRSHHYKSKVNKRSVFTHCAVDGMKRGGGKKEEEEEKEVEKKDIFLSTGVVENTTLHFVSISCRVWWCAHRRSVLVGRVVVLIRPHLLRLLFSLAAP